MAQLSTKLPWELAQTKWASTLNPFLALPILNGVQIDDIILVSGTAKTVNHLLQRKPQGWFLVGNSSNSVIWSAANNDLVITLQASANTTVSIWVY